MLPSRKWAAAMTASQTDPSLSSPSPINVTTRLRAAVEASRERHPDRDRQAVAERAGRRLDARQVVAARMHAEPAAERAVRGVDLLDVEEAAVGHRDVERAGAVTLAEQEPVAVVPGRALGVDLHQVLEDHRHQVGHRQVAADVQVRAVGEAQQPLAHLERLALKPLQRSRRLPWC